MSRPAARVPLGVTIQGDLTPEMLSRLGGKLGSPIIANLIAQIKSGHVRSCALDLGDGVSITYPAPEGALKIHCK